MPYLVRGPSNEKENLEKQTFRIAPKQGSLRKEL